MQIKLFTAFSLRVFDPKDDRQTCRYDAYIMYCDKDYAWAQRTLLVGLECLGFRVYDKHRDSDYRDLGVQIEDALTASQRVIVVMSPSFVSDSRCLNEFDRAVSHHKNKKKSRFVVLVSLFPTGSTITLDNSEQVLPFIDYLKHGCYADVYSKDFWRRLLFWLPNPLRLPDSTANIDPVQYENSVQDDSRSDVV